MSVELLQTSKLHRFLRHERTRNRIKCEAHGEHGAAGSEGAVKCHCLDELLARRIELYFDFSKMVLRRLREENRVETRAVGRVGEEDKAAAENDERQAAKLLKDEIESSDKKAEAKCVDASNQVPVIDACFFCWLRKQTQVRGGKSQEASDPDQRVADQDRERGKLEIQI